MVKSRAEQKKRPGEQDKRDGLRDGGMEVCYMEECQERQASPELVNQVEMF